MTARAAGAALLSSLAFAGAASAVPPTAGCPSGDGSAWELFEPIHEQHLDHNGDGFICRRFVNNGNLTWRDNNVQG
jgi:hypothetical protein